MTTKTKAQMTKMTRNQLAVEWEAAGYPLDMMDSLTKAQIIDQILNPVGAAQPAEPKAEDADLNALVEDIAAAADEPTAEPQTEAPADKPAEKKARKNTRKTVADLTAEVVNALAEAGADLAAYTIEVNSKNTAVHVKCGKRRVFGYSGPILVVNSDKYLTGIGAEKKNYGYRVAVADMVAVCRNFIEAQKTEAEPKPEAAVEPAAEAEDAAE